MSYMFYGCSGLTNLDLSSFFTLSVTNMYSMFASCANLNTIYVGNGWITGQANSGDMFYGCPGNLTSSGKILPFAYGKLSDDGTMITYYYDDNVADGCVAVGEIPSDKRSKLTNVVFDSSLANCTTLTSIAYCFYQCDKLTTIMGIENLKTDNVKDMRAMFYGCSSLTSLDVSGFKTDNVKDMGYMFYGCSSLTSLDVSCFKTDNVTDMSCMFYNCSSLTSLDVSGFKTDNVTDMGWMFLGCSSLTSLDVSGFNTDNVTNMKSMFCKCSSLTSLDLSGFKTDNVTDMSYMFYECSGLTTIFVGDGWSVDGHLGADQMVDLFFGCTNLVGGQGTVYDSGHTDFTYARIDGGAEDPGYFTRKSGGETAIDGVEADGRIGGASGVYTLTGTKVRQQVDDLRGLPAGVYVVDGRKVVVR